MCGNNMSPMELLLAFGVCFMLGAATAVLGSKYSAFNTKMMREKFEKEFKTRAV